LGWLPQPYFDKFGKIFTYCNLRGAELIPSSSPNRILHQEDISNAYSMSSTISNVLDKLYIVFVIVLLLGIVGFDVLHWPVWPKAWVPSFSRDLELFHIKTFNDPLSANLPVPNGWQSGMYFCEQLHLPFLFYILFAKSTIPILKHSFKPLGFPANHRRNKERIRVYYCGDTDWRRC
jgi:hypothetical protein